jgi:hypothetical protein
MRFIIALVALSLSARGLADETPHFAFASEYVRELGVNEKLRELAQKELQELARKDLAEPGADRNAVMAAGDTRTVNELTAQITIMKGMTLNAPFDWLPALIADLYEQEIEAYNQMIAIAVDLMDGPEPGIDYVKFVVDRSRFTAMIERPGQALAAITPLVFATLIVPKPDNQGNKKRLEITRAERDALVRTLQTDFGDKMNQTDQNYIVRSAGELRDYLTSKDYKCSDDPL